MTRTSPLEFECTQNGTPFQSYCYCYNGVRLCLCGTAAANRLCLCGTAAANRLCLCGTAAANRLCLCGTATANRLTFHSPDDTCANMEQRWNDTDRGKQKDSDKSLSQCHFVHQKFHMEWTSAVRIRRLTA
jgi:hypothetical protein